MTIEEAEKMVGKKVRYMYAKKVGKIKSVRKMKSFDMILADLEDNSVVNIDLLEVVE